MIDLKLLGRLQSSDMVTLVLKQVHADELTYYIIAKSINYTAVTSGKCHGNVHGDFAMFNILLSSLLPMLDRGYKFNIQYEGAELEFVTDDEKIHLHPLCVEYSDPSVMTVVNKVANFLTDISSDDTVDERVKKVEFELMGLRERQKPISKMDLEGAMISSNPFSMPATVLEPDEETQAKINKLEADLATLKKRQGKVRPVNLAPFRYLCGAAARSHELLNFCETYAVMSLKNTYILQKGPCPIMSMQSTLLNQLMIDGEGENFYWYQNGLAYVSYGDSTTVVFMEKYLPNTSIDSSIVTRGKVLEKYQINTRGVLAIASVVGSKFPVMKLDMSRGVLILENDKGEVLRSDLGEIKATTPELEKMMRGEETTGKIVMSTLNIPPEVQRFLSLFREQLNIYVKERKIVFNSEKLYLVFGRERSV